MLNTRLQSYINAFSDLKVLVIGEAMLDSYLKGSTERLCREAPVPVVSLESREHVPGGAGNTAVNIRSLGAQVSFLSVIGADAEGGQLIQALEARGVSTEHITRRPERETLAKQRVIAASQMVVRFDQGSSDRIGLEAEIALIRSLENVFPLVDAVIVSDYDYGVLTPRLIQALEAGRSVALVSDAGTPLVSDPGYRLAQQAIAAGYRVVDSGRFQPEQQHSERQRRG